MATNTDPFIANLNNLAATIDARFDRLEESFGRIERDVKFLVYVYYLDMAERFAPIIAYELGLNYTRRLDTAEIFHIARNSDTSDIPTNELRSFLRADVVIEAKSDQDADAHYIAVEVSYTADGRDSHRATRNARYLAEFIGGAHTHAVVASHRYDNEVANLIERGTLNWFELTTGDLEVNGE